MGLFRVILIMPSNGSIGFYRGSSRGLGVRLWRLGLGDG